MKQANPYSPPSSTVADAEDSFIDLDRHNRIAAGQRMMVFAVLVSLLAMPLRAVTGEFTLAISIVTAILAVVGVVRLTRGLGHSVPVCILCAILMIVPLLNLIVMLILNARATRRLRAAGYRVGLLGAKPRKD
ncbi:MAG: hypothetical protein LBQ62_06815 [Candidatus Accumulibacter sp.]|nr:hypothetical protein [Accumulibacter sp.]